MYIIIARRSGGSPQRLACFKYRQGFAVSFDLPSPCGTFQQKDIMVNFVKPGLELMLLLKLPDCAFYPRFLNTIASKNKQFSTI